MKLKSILIIAHIGIFSLLYFTLALATEEPPLQNHTFDEFGFKAKTFSGTENQEVNITFSSPIKNPNSILYPHLMIVNSGCVEIKINDAAFFREDLSEGEYFGKLEIPTGLIVEGPNTLSFLFPAIYVDPNRYIPNDDYYKRHEITVLGDSIIQLGSSFSNKDSPKIPDATEASSGISKTPEISEPLGTGTVNAAIKSPNNQINGNSNIINNIVNDINNYVSNSGNSVVNNNFNLVLEVVLLALLSVAMIKYAPVILKKRKK